MANLQPIPREPIGDTHQWREWLNSLGNNTTTTSVVVQTIQGQIANATITSSTVTTALGYTPASYNGSNAIGVWNISILGNSASSTMAQDTLTYGDDVLLWLS